MKITLCGSMAFVDEMVDVKKRLESVGHQIQMPPLEVPDGSGKMIPVKDYWTIRKTANANTKWVWDRKAEAIGNHFEKIAWSNAILVTNFDKKGIPGYIGANTLVEMGIAFYLKKPIYLLNQIPKLSYTEEILGMKPIVIAGKLEAIGSEVGK